jgi:hypothetical protein
MGMKRYREEEEEERNTNQLSCWVVNKENEFVPCMYTVPTLPPGKYKIKWNSAYNSYAFLKQSINLDELLELPNTIFKEILSDIDYFWNNKEIFEKYKYVHKRGILLHGNPGCGKSCIIEMLADRVIKRGGIVFSIFTYDDLILYSAEITNTLRVIEPETPIMIAFEDLDTLVGNKESETTLLNLLDGTTQSNNILHIGSTNHPEKLEERILNRPSRFDRKYYIGLPDEAVREYYLSCKITKEDIEKYGGEKFIKDIVKKSEGLTIAHLGEFVKSVFIFNNDPYDIIELLKGMGKHVSSRNNDGNLNIGFSKK